MSAQWEAYPDPRRSGAVAYSLHNCVMSAFSMMYFQDPSLLQFQKRLQDKIHKNNLAALFKVDSIPQDTALRELLDALDPGAIEPLFAEFFRRLQRAKKMELFQVLDGKYLIALDGSEYFSSYQIHCPQCLFKKKSNGRTLWYHQILQAAIVCPGQRQVVPLAPEPITNKDGTEKQDCEINAAKRILKKIRKAHPKLPIIIGGDGLYSKQPFIDELKQHRMSYVLVAKPDDHKVLFEWFHELQRLGQTKTMTLTDPKKRRHVYEWVQGVPLNGREDADDVGFFQYSLIVDGKRNYHNSWVTDVSITEDNVDQLVKIGRARWKIENETFNTLKNQGYHVEHNFGHGRNNLSYNFFLLNLLAFFMHQIFELSDPLYQNCRFKVGTRLEYWNQLRCTIRIMVFDNWEQLLWLILDPENNRPP